MLSDRVCEGLEVTCEDLPLLLGEICMILAQGEYGEDCVSLSLNTQPLQPHVQLSQKLELVDQIIVFTKPTSSISSTLSFPHSCVDEPDHYYLKILTKDFLYFLNPISSVSLSSSCLSYVYAFLLCVCLSFHHDDYVVALLCLYLSTYSAASCS